MLKNCESEYFRGRDKLGKQSGDGIMNLTTITNGSLELET